MPRTIISAVGTWLINNAGRKIGADKARDKTALVRYLQSEPQENAGAEANALSRVMRQETGWSFRARSWRAYEKNLAELPEDGVFLSSAARRIPAQAPPSTRYVMCARIARLAPGRFRPSKFFGLHDLHQSTSGGTHFLL